MNSINTTDLVDGQTLSGDNQMTIMEAITDIYNLIAIKINYLLVIFHKKMLAREIRHAK